MLRTSLRSVGPLRSRPAALTAGRQWPVAALQPSRLTVKRSFADDKKPTSDPSRPAAIPTSETRTASSGPVPPPASTTTSSSIPPSEVPLTPPPPPPPPAPAATTPPPPSPPPRKKKGVLRRLSNYVLTLAILGALAFGGGVWYSRVNDNFHDFFTEYVPFGEQAVLYLEEMDFRKRFPHVSQRLGARPRTDDGAAVKIPAQSGASWRVAAAEPSKPGSATEKPKGGAVKEAASQEKPNMEAKAAAAPSPVKKDEIKPAPKAQETTASESPEPPKTPVAGAIPVTAEAPSTPPPEESTPGAKPFKAPEVDEPSRWPPASPIDPLTVEGAKEPLVQDLLKMLNDIITVINADGANEKYASTIGKAKNELKTVGKKIADIRAKVEKKAAKQVRARVDRFDQAANELINRVEAAMDAQEAQWRREFETEMAQLKDNYDEKLKLVMEREKQINEERINNRLLEQVVEMKRQFAQEVKSHVEAERDGRLGRLDDLSSAVSELEKLTTGWNDVVDANLRTQQLHVAVEAVRASLEDSQHPHPFVKELVALKEIAAVDPVVDAAIASINPAAYQRGIASAPELVDRFRRVATEVRKASLLPDNAGVASHASSWALSKLLFRRQGLAAGDDVESILTRAQTYLEEGDLDNAAREVNGLTGWAKTLSRDWLGEVRKVLEVQQALEVIATEARLQSLKVE